jgi:MerR family transcriptional regulator, copper efflux regulator
MNIGEAAAAAKLSAKMIRHYEGIGLLPKAGRTASNYRVYGPNDVHVLRFIKRARTLGFSIEDIRELLGLWRNKSRSSAAVKRIAGKHADHLKQRIGEMQSIVNAIEHLSRHCHGDNRPTCPILDDLGKPD